MQHALAWLKLLRVGQWTKNGFVFVALIFARQIEHAEAIVACSIMFAGFCLMSSAVYLVNDIHDAPRDRLHPEKRLRPVAAGTIAPGPALGVAFLLAGAAVVITGLLEPKLVWFVGGYLGLQLAYTFALKQVVILDLFCIAAGFVLRVAAGAEAIFVPVSNWLFLCTIMIALFLAAAKRRHEVETLAGDASGHRRSLKEYNTKLLDQLLVITGTSTVVAYSLYTMAQETVAKFGTDRLKFTIPFVLFGIFRYLFLVHIRKEGGAPDKLMVRDLPLVLNVLAYTATVAWAIYRF